MGRIIFAAAAAGLFLTSAAGAQESPRIFPGFEKVYKESKKKEAEALRATAAAESEIAASQAQRANGERQIADAEAAMQSQQLSYLTLTRGFGSALTSRDARVEAQSLEAVARVWADAEEMKEKGAKTVLAADASLARASDRLAAAQGKLAEARVALARTLEDAPSPQPGAEPAALAGTLTPTPVDAETLPPAPKEEAALSVPASAEPRSALDALLLGGPDGD
ncbi:MAG: hypothetical protein ACKVS5_00530 [Parvularculaceae bacterium]